MAGIYVHIPFCASRCIYCGFYSTTGLNLQEQYVDALLKEMQMQRHLNIGEIATLYFGGGTPSTLPTHLLDRLISGIITPDTHLSEFTMECNPDDITPAMVQWLASSPVNRVSMGVQTFNDERLRWLHRRHTSRQAIEAMTLLRNHSIRNISIDLMFGFPNQTLDQWKEDVRQALALRPEHISAYSLMYEEGTPLYRMLENHTVCEIDDELSLQMFDYLVDELCAHGYEHYEISNFALPGCRSQHNSSYWHQVPYLGLGAAAHSYDGKERWWNIDDIQTYIDSICKDILPAERETIDEQTRYNDIITTALRTCEGIDIESLTEPQRQYIMKQARPHMDSGMMKLTGKNLHLTRKGIYVSNDIMADLIFVE